MDDRRVLNGIYWRLRTGSPWADIPERYGPSTTCYNRFVRWRKLGVRDRIFDAVTKAYDGDVQMIDSSSIRVHHHGANAKGGAKTATGDDADPRWHGALARLTEVEEVRTGGGRRSSGNGCLLPASAVLPR